MNEILNWSTLGTYGGALTVVVALTQLTKNIPAIKKIPTQLLSYIIATSILFCAHAFTNTFTMDNVLLSLINGVVVSVASNGGFSAVKKIVENFQDNG